MAIAVTLRDASWLFGYYFKNLSQKLNEIDSDLGFLDAVDNAAAPILLAADDQAVPLSYWTEFKSHPNLSERTFTQRQKAKILTAAIDHLSSPDKGENDRNMDWDLICKHLNANRFGINVYKVNASPHIEVIRFKQKLNSFLTNPNTSISYIIHFLTNNPETACLLPEAVWLDMASNDNHKVELLSFISKNPKFRKKLIAQKGPDFLFKVFTRISTSEQKEAFYSYISNRYDGKGKANDFYDDLLRKMSPKKLAGLAKKSIRVAYALFKKPGLLKQSKAEQVSSLTQLFETHSMDLRMLEMMLRLYRNNPDNYNSLSVGKSNLVDYFNGSFSRFISYQEQLNRLNTFAPSMPLKEKNARFNQINNLLFLLQHQKQYARFLNAQDLAVIFSIFADSDVRINPMSIFEMMLTYIPIKTIEQLFEAAGKRNAGLMNDPNREVNQGLDQLAKLLFKSKNALLADRLVKYPLLVKKLYSNDDPTTNLQISSNIIGLSELSDNPVKLTETLSKKSALTPQTIAHLVPHIETKYPSRFNGWWKNIGITATSFVNYVKTKVGVFSTLSEEEKELVTKVISSNQGRGKCYLTKSGKLTRELLDIINSPNPDQRICKAFANDRIIWSEIVKLNSAESSLSLKSPYFFAKFKNIKLVDLVDPQSINSNKANFDANFLGMFEVIFASDSELLNEILLNLSLEKLLLLSRQYNSVARAIVNRQDILSRLFNERVPLNQHLQFLHILQDDNVISDEVRNQFALEIIRVATAKELIQKSTAHFGIRIVVESSSEHRRALYEKAQGLFQFIALVSSREESQFVISLLALENKAQIVVGFDNDSVTSHLMLNIADNENAALVLNQLLLDSEITSKLSVEAVIKLQSIPTDKVPAIAPIIKARARDVFVAATKSIDTLNANKVSFRELWSDVDFKDGLTAQTLLNCFDHEGNFYDSEIFLSLSSDKSLECLRAVDEDRAVSIFRKNPEFVTALIKPARVDLTLKDLRRIFSVNAAYMINQPQLFASLWQEEGFKDSFPVELIPNLFDSNGQPIDRSIPALELLQKYINKAVHEWLYQPDRQRHVATMLRENHHLLVNLSGLSQQDIRNLCEAEVFSKFNDEEFAGFYNANSQVIKKTVLASVRVFPKLTDKVCEDALKEKDHKTIRAMLKMQNASVLIAKIKDHMRANPAYLVEFLNDSETNKEDVEKVYTLIVDMLEDTSKAEYYNRFTSSTLVKIYQSLKCDDALKKLPELIVKLLSELSFDERGLCKALLMDHLRWSYENLTQADALKLLQMGYKNEMYNDYRLWKTLNKAVDSLVVDDFNLLLDSILSTNDVRYLEDPILSSALREHIEDQWCKNLSAYTLKLKEFFKNKVTRNALLSSVGNKEIAMLLDSDEMLNIFFNPDHRENDTYIKSHFSQVLCELPNTVNIFLRIIDIPNIEKANAGYFSKERLRALLSCNNPAITAWVIKQSEMFSDLKELFKTAKIDLNNNAIARALISAENIAQSIVMTKEKCHQLVRHGNDYWKWVFKHRDAFIDEFNLFIAEMDLSNLETARMIVTGEFISKLNLTEEKLDTLFNLKDEAINNLIIQNAAGIPGFKNVVVKRLSAKPASDIALLDQILADVPARKIVLPEVELASDLIKKLSVIDNIVLELGLNRERVKQLFKVAGLNLVSTNRSFALEEDNVFAATSLSARSSSSENAVQKWYSQYSSAFDEWLDFSDKDTIKFFIATAPSKLFNFIENDKEKMLTILTVNDDEITTWVLNNQSRLKVVKEICQSREGYKKIHHNALFVANTISVENTSIEDFLDLALRTDSDSIKVTQAVLASEMPSTKAYREIYKPFIDSHSRCAQLHSNLKMPYESHSPQHSPRSVHVQASELTSMHKSVLELTKHHFPDLISLAENTKRPLSMLEKQKHLVAAYKRAHAAILKDKDVREGHKVQVAGQKDKVPGLLYLIDTLVLELLKGDDYSLSLLASILILRDTLMLKPKQASFLTRALSSSSVASASSEFMYLDKLDRTFLDGLKACSLDRLFQILQVRDISVVIRLYYKANIFNHLKERSNLDVFNLGFLANASNRDVIDALLEDDPKLKRELIQNACMHIHSDSKGDAFKYLVTHDSLFEWVSINAFDELKQLIISAIDRKELTIEEVLRSVKASNILDADDLLERIKTPEQARMCFHYSHLLTKFNEPDYANALMLKAKLDHVAAERLVAIFSPALSQYSYINTEIQKAKVDPSAIPARRSLNVPAHVVSLLSSAADPSLSKESVAPVLASTSDSNNVTNVVSVPSLQSPPPPPPPSLKLPPLPPLAKGSVSALPPIASLDKDGNKSAADSLGVRVFVFNHLQKKLKKDKDWASIRTEIVSKIEARETIEESYWESHFDKVTEDEFKQAVSSLKDSVKGKSSLASNASSKPASKQAPAAGSTNIAAAAAAAIASRGNRAPKEVTINGLSSEVVNKLQSIVSAAGAWTGFPNKLERLLEDKTVGNDDLFKTKLSTLLSAHGVSDLDPTLVTSLVEAWKINASKNATSNSSAAITKGLSRKPAPKASPKQQQPLVSSSSDQPPAPPLRSDDDSDGLPPPPPPARDAASLPPPPPAKKAAASSLPNAAAADVTPSRGNLMASIVNVKKAQFFRKVAVTGLPEDLVNEALQLNSNESQEIVRQLNSIMNCDNDTFRQTLFGKFKKLFSNEQADSIDRLITRIKGIIRENEERLRSEAAAKGEGTQKTLADTLSFAINRRGEASNPDANPNDGDWDSDDDAPPLSPSLLSSRSKS